MCILDSVFEVLAFVTVFYESFALFGILDKPFGVIVGSFIYFKKVG